MTVPVAVETPPPAGWGRWGLRTLTSMRTAIVLLCFLALASVPGSLFPQRGVASDPAAVLTFEEEHPRLSPWLDRLGMFEVYSAPWFAAIYLLLLVSMTGCVLPRSLRLWRATRADPPPAPTNLTRLEHYRAVAVREHDAPAALESAAARLRAAHFRVRTEKGEVRAERGYLREFGNLLFHLSLLVLLVGVAVGKLFGFEGRVALAEGSGFVNTTSQYDVFTPSALTDVDGLTPFSFTLERFSVGYEREGPQRGDPRAFEAELAVEEGKPARTVVVKPNEPLEVEGTKAFLTGHGYAPEVTVRDGRGDIALSGPIIFLPNDGSYASDGVVKVPDARPEELAFEGFFLPTGSVGPNGPYSAFPDALNPQLFLTAYAGDLGLGDGLPQSVFTLDKDSLEQFRDGGKPLARVLEPGETMKLPDGRGTLTFDGVSRFANFQIAYDPGKEISLLAAILLLVGLTASLTIPRRRVWLRVATDDVTGDRRIEFGALSLTRRDVPVRDADLVADALRAYAPPSAESITEEVTHARI